MKLVTGAEGLLDHALFAHEDPLDGLSILVINIEYAGRFVDRDIFCLQHDQKLGSRFIVNFVILSNHILGFDM